MKKLSEFVNRKKPNKNGFCTFDEYCDINSINEDNISEKDIRFYYNFRYFYIPDCVGDTYKEHLYETLTSHSKESLMNRLINLLSDYIIDIDPNDTKKLSKGGFGFLISKDCPIFGEDDKDFLSSFELSDCELSDKIYDILEFYKYYITYIEEYKDEKVEGYILAIESYFTEDARKYVKENGNILYHITTPYNVPDILRKGLRPKTGKRKYQGGYRYFPERLFLISNSKDIIKDIEETKNVKRYKDYSILKIDLKNHDISLWFDDSSDSKNCVYTLEAIPPTLIEEIELKDIYERQ